MYSRVTPTCLSIQRLTFLSIQRLTFLSIQRPTVHFLKYRGLHFYQYRGLQFYQYRGLHFYQYRGLHFYQYRGLQFYQYRGLQYISINTESYISINTEAYMYVSINTEAYISFYHSIYLCNLGGPPVAPLLMLPAWALEAICLTPTQTSLSSVMLSWLGSFVVAGPATASRGDLFISRLSATPMRGYNTMHRHQSYYLHPKLWWDLTKLVYKLYQLVSIGFLMLMTAMCAVNTVNISLFWTVFHKGAKWAAICVHIKKKHTAFAKHILSMHIWFQPCALFTKVNG